MNITITKKEFDALPATAKTLLSGITIVKEKRKATKVNRRKQEKSYYLECQTFCTTCSDYKKEIFLMLPSNTQIPGLVATCPVPKTLPENFKPDKIRQSSVRICDNCRQRLSEWTKEELIEYILEKRRPTIKRSESKQYRVTHGE